MNYRSTCGAALTVAAMVIAVVGAQSPASAEQALGQTAGITDTTPNPTTTYSFTSRTSYWSVIGILPPANVDYDLTVTSPNGANSSSIVGPGSADFVAVNSNAPCPEMSTYLATVSRYAGSGDFRLGVDTGHVATVGSNGNDISLQAGFLAVSDVYLRQGVRYSFLAPPDRPGHFSQVFILGSDPAQPGTCLRSRTQAIAFTTGDTWELPNVQVPRNGWYAAVRIAPDQQTPLPFWITQQS